MRDPCALVSLPSKESPPPWPSARANPAAGAWSMATAARRGTRRLTHWRMRRAFPRRPVEAAAGEVSSLVSGDGEVEVPSSPGTPPEEDQRRQAAKATTARVEEARGGRRSSESEAQPGFTLGTH